MYRCSYINLKAPILFVKVFKPVVHEEFWKKGPEESARGTHTDSSDPIHRNSGQHMTFPATRCHYRSPANVVKTLEIEEARKSEHSWIERRCLSQEEDSTPRRNSVNSRDFRQAGTRIQSVINIFLPPESRPGFMKTLWVIRCNR